MNNVQILKQIALSVFTRRKKWVLLVSLLGVALFMPIAYMMSKEPPRHRTVSTILMETRPDRAPLFQEFSPFRPLDVQLAILRSRSLSEAVVESLPRNSVDDLVQNPYSVDYNLEFQNWIRRLRGEEVVVESPQRRALSELRSSRVRFRPVGESGIVEITAEASQPRVAMDIANTYIEVLVSRTRSFNVEDIEDDPRVPGAAAVPDRQDLGAAEESMRQFTSARGRRPRPRPSRRGGHPPDPAREHVRRGRGEQEHGSEPARRAEVEGRRDAALVRRGGQARPAPPPPAPSRRASSASGPSCRPSRRSSSSTRSQYTDEHPRVITAKRQIADVQKELGDAVKEGTPVPTAGSTVPAARPLCLRRDHGRARDLQPVPQRPGGGPPRADRQPEEEPDRAVARRARVHPPRHRRRSPTAASTRCCRRSSPPRASASRAR